MLFSFLFDFLFPPRCPSCSVYVERRGGFCAACARQLIGLHTLTCTGETRTYLDGVWAFAHYRAGVRDLLRALKYQKKCSVLPALHTILTMGAEVLTRIPHPIVAVAVSPFAEKAHLCGFHQGGGSFATRGL